jgi:hypothetical protein
MAVAAQKDTRRIHMSIIGNKEASGAGSPITLTPEQEAHIATLPFEEIKNYLRECAAEQNIIDLDSQGGVSMPSRPTPLTSAERVEVNVNGQTHVKIAEWRTSDGDLGRKLAVDAAQKAAIAEAMGATQQTPEERAAAAAAAVSPFKNLVYDPIAKRYRAQDGTFLSDAQAQQLVKESSVAGVELARQTELELKFKRGEITSDQYLRESGAVDRVLDQREVQSWSDATTEATAEGGPLEDWPGSPDGVLLERLGKKIEELGLENAQNKVSALAEAWSALRAEMEESEDAKAMSEYEKELAACTSREQIDEVQQRYFAGRTNLGRSIWNS